MTGGEKAFFSAEVNLLTQEEIHQSMAQLRAQPSRSETKLKQRAALAAGLFQPAAERQGITRKLRRENNIATARLMGSSGGPFSSYSTVTDLARLRGLSISQPRFRAT